MRTSKHSTGQNTETQLTLFPAATHASQALSLEIERAKTMIATSGLKCFDALKRLGRVGFSTKMLPELFLTEFSTKRLSIWKVKATPAGRPLLYLQVLSERLTNGTDVSLLPTVSANEMKYRIQGNSQQSNCLAAIVRKMRPIPTNSMSTYQDFIQAKQHSTKRQKYSEIMNPDGLILLENGIGEQTGMILHPNFVEWMMGLPKDWSTKDTD